MLKKIFASLLMAVMFLISTQAFAAHEETVVDESKLAEVKTLAVALPMHFKIEATEPTVLEFAAILSNAARISKVPVVTYDDMVENIWRDARVDIKALYDDNAKKIYLENVGKHADAYVIATSANNNKYTQFFFDVYDAKTADLIYRLSTQSRGYSKDLKGYTKACEDFYKQFDKVVEQAVKSARKKK